MSLENQHLIITGGGSGIGKSIAIYAAKKGAKVSILARNNAKLNTVVSEIKSLGGEAQAISCDVQKKENVFQAFAEAVETFGAIRAVIANAGIGGANHDGDDDRFDQIIQTNLSGAYYSLRAGQRNLIDDGKSRQLIVISSCLSRFGVPGYTAYCASKAGLLGLVRALALEVSQQNIQVNAICPGWVNTKMARDGIEEMAKGMGRSYEDAYRAAMRAVPLGRMSEPEEIASLVGWLLSEGSSMTGQALDINGGSWMG